MPAALQSSAASQNGAKKRRTFFTSSLSTFPVPAALKKTKAAVPSKSVFAALQSHSEQEKTEARIMAAEVKVEVREETDEEEEEDEADVDNDLQALNRRSLSPADDLEEEVSLVSPTTSRRPHRSLQNTAPSSKPRAQNARNAVPSPVRQSAPKAGPSRPSKPPLSSLALPPRPMLAATKPTLASQHMKNKKPQTVTTPPGRVAARENRAQSSNERLSMLMEDSMRASIGGREAPYQRIPVYEGHVVRNSAGVSPRNLSHKAKGKQRATAVKVERTSPGSGKARSSHKGRQQIQQSTKGKTQVKVEPGSRPSEMKQYLTAGVYCQDASAKSPHKLVSRILTHAGPSNSVVESKKGKSKAKTNKLSNTDKGRGFVFPPLPYDYGYELFFGQEHDFVLPYDIHNEAVCGTLNAKKKPAPYHKIRSSESLRLSPCITTPS